MQKGHPSYGGGRPRTAVPEAKELIELGKDLVAWASEKQEKGDPLRARFCDWYTDRGFIRTQWELFRYKSEFIWYYERARTILASRYIDGTVNPSIAHRYLRIYDPEVRDEEDKDADATELRKASSLKGEARAVEEERQKVLDEVQRNKRSIK